MPYWIYIGTAIIYAIRIAVFTIGAIIERKRIIRSSTKTVNELPFVSVIVPARNEEGNIEKCIASLLKSDYPVEKLEILIIDDRSTDSTGAIANNLQIQYPHIKAIHLTDERQGNLRGKPGALDAAIRQSRGDIILMTDADCEVQPTWISVHVKQFTDEHTGLVASFTTIRPSTVFAQMQSVEWVLTHTMASAGIGLRQPLGCFGNNLAVRKTTYFEVGGYGGIPFSVTEDLALLQTVIKKGWDVRYVCDYSCAVETLPCETLGEYVRQHHRWLRGGTALGWRGAVFVLFSASLWISLATAILNQQWVLLPLILTIRLIGDLAVIAPSLSALRRKDLYPWALLAVFFITALELVIPFSLLKKEVVWKGQKFR